jgi:hypothetical protein
MANKLNWDSSPSLTSYLTTGLNSLANDAQVLGAEIDNSTALDTFADVEFNVATQGSARSAGAHIAVFLIPALDGTNYAYGDGSVDPPANRLIATLPLDAATTARRVAAQMLSIPPGKYKLLFENKTGQAMASSGNTAGYRNYSLEVQ